MSDNLFYREVPVLHNRTLVGKSKFPGFQKISLLGSSNTKSNFSLNFGSWGKKGNIPVRFNLFRAQLLVTREFCCRKLWTEAYNVFLDGYSITISTAGIFLVFIKSVFWYVLLTYRYGMMKISNILNNWKYRMYSRYYSKY